MVEVFEAVKRVLRPEGVVFLNVGDAYRSGGRPSWCADAKLPIRGRDGWPPTPPTLKPKDLCGLPWRLALALQAAGWWLRQDIIWSKKVPLPESVQDRCTKSHEYLFLLSKRPMYHFDAEAIKEPAHDWGLRTRSQGKYHTNGFALAGQPPHGGLTNGNSAETGRNKRSVWHLGPESFPGAHFATFPTRLVEPCVLAGCPPDGVVLDPFIGSGTTALVAVQHGRHAVGIDLNARYLDLALQRLTPALAQLPLFAGTPAPRV